MFSIRSPTSGATSLELAFRVATPSAGWTVRTVTGSPVLVAVASGGRNLIYAAGDRGEVYKWNGSAWTQTPAPATNSTPEVRQMALAAGPSGGPIIGLVGAAPPQNYVASIGPATTTQTRRLWGIGGCPGPGCAMPWTTTPLPGRAELLVSGNTFESDVSGNSRFYGVGILDATGATGSDAPCAGNDCSIRGLVALGTSTLTQITALTNTCNLYTGQYAGVGVYGWQPARTSVLGGTAPLCKGLRGHATSGFLAFDARQVVHLATASSQPEGLLNAPSLDTWAGVGVRPDGKFVAVSHDGLVLVWTPGAGWATTWERTGLTQVRAVNSADDGTIVAVSEGGEVSVRAP